MPVKKKEETLELVIMPLKTMRGHTDRVKGVVHLPGGRHIITCSLDGSLRLWDLEDGAQIGEDWRDEGDEEAMVYQMALSPNGKTVASGSNSGKVRLWDIKTGKVISKWTEYTRGVLSVCWNMDGSRVASGSFGRMVTVRDVKSGYIILLIKIGHWDESVWAVIYSPDNTQIATGGSNAVKIWSANTGDLLATLKHDRIVRSLAWTSDGRRLISGSYGPIRIFDTTTWRQIAILRGHIHWVLTISLSQNNRLLVSASDDKIARFWNLDTNLPIGSLLWHRNQVECAAFSIEEKVLVTGCGDENVYTWDIHSILKQAGLEDLLSTGTNIVSANILPTLSH
jgi:WD40 repeat protein